MDRQASLVNRENRAALFSTGGSSSSRAQSQYYDYEGAAAAGGSNSTAGSSANGYSRPSSRLAGRNDAQNATMNHRAFASAQVSEDLEGQNDEKLEGLSAKVKMLKEITVGIRNEVKDSTTFIGDMNGNFESAQNALSTTFTRMNAMARRQGSQFWKWLAFITLVFWIFVWRWLFH